MSLVIASLDGKKWPTICLRRCMTKRHRSAMRMMKVTGKAWMIIKNVKRWPSGRSTWPGGPLIVCPPLRPVLLLTSGDKKYYSKNGKAESTIIARLGAVKQFRPVRFACKIWI